MGIIAKFWSKHWQWIVGVIAGALVTLVTWSYNTGMAIGQHTSADEQKWKANDGDHKEFKDLGQKLLADTSEIKGELKQINALLSKSNYSTQYAPRLSRDSATDRTQIAESRP